MGLGKRAPELLLVHGWGLGPGMWHPMLRHLSGWMVHPIDLGYFGPPRTSPLLSGSGPLLAVGHSLGFLWLLRQVQLGSPVGEALLTRKASLLAINAFARFSRADDFPRGVHPRILKRMMRRLGEDPGATLSAFRKQAGVPAGGSALPPGIDPGRLQGGLEGLLNWDGRPTLADWKPPLLALASDDDGVSPPAMSAASFPEMVLRRRVEGGHMLPLSQPAWCAGQLWALHRHGLSSTEQQP